jgi:hypothetical protein
MNTYIRDLDDSLRERGEDVILRRVVGTGNVESLDVTVRASAKRQYVMNDLQGSNFEDTFKLIFSPTQIIDAQWPGGSVLGSAPFDVDPSLPRRGDYVVMKGRTYRVDEVDPIAIDNEVVRFEVMVTGGTRT